MTSVGRVARETYSRVRAIAARARGHHAEQLLRVVIPVRDDAPFLDECLKSVLSSSHRVLDVVVIGDGADPGVPLRRPAVSRATDRRVRTASAREALDGGDAKFIVVVDPDDIVPSRAYERMVGSLAESGSDFVMGSIFHQVGGGFREPSWGSVLHPRRQRLDATKCPEAMVDLSLHSKLFRTDFWLSAGLAKGGSALQDPTLTTTTAFLEAAAFDLVPARVYDSCVRDISLPVDEQARFSPTRAQEFMDSLLRSAALVRERRKDLYRAWLTGVFEHVLPPLFVNAVGGGGRFHLALASGVRILLREATPALESVSVGNRLTAWCAANGTLTDLALALDFLADNPDGLPHRAGPRADELSVVTDLSLSVDPPEELLRIRAVDRRLHLRLTRVARDDSEARVDGAAFVDYLEDPELPSVTLHVDRGEALPLVVERRADPTINTWARRAWEDRTHTGFTVRLPAAELPTDDATPVQLELTLSGCTKVVAVRLPAARQHGAAGRRDLVVEEASVDGHRLRLSGRGAAPLGWRCSLRGPRARVQSAELVTDGERFDADLPLSIELWGEVTSLPADRYALSVHAPDGEDCQVTLADSLVASDLPDLLNDRLRIWFDHEGIAPLVLVGLPLQVQERGSYNQRRLQAHAHVSPARASDAGTVLLESFRGSSVGDNPGALGRELIRRDLGLRLAWVVDDPSVRTSSGTVRVTRRSREWYELLAHAHAYIGNAGAPYFFRKATGQLHLQTWHGTPLKRIGEDRGPGDFNTWRHRRRIAEQAAGWDAMVSPSPYCTEIFRSAFRYEGTMLEVGYPRNDVLVSGQAGEVRLRVRSLLGISAAQRVVLYAPTWREYVGVRDSKPLYLDAEMLTRQLADTIVLVRGHYNSASEADVFSGHDRIIDVTRFPDVAELYLAADVLVTDYSSVMFDFALTDKPILLLTPDLEQYRDVERGFYFDIEQDAPGPLLRSTTAVIDELEGPDLYAPQRAAFRERFCPWDDGSASSRVVDFLLGKW